jgi:Haem-degrading
MNVAVVDSGGNLVAFQRMDDAMLASIKIAEHEAGAAAMFRRETKVFENAIQLNSFNYLMTLEGSIAPRGGIPLIEEGKLIGAIGCSGGDRLTGKPLRLREKEWSAVPLENLEVSERMGIILSIRILLRCSLFLRHCLALCLPCSVLGRCLR